MAEASSSSPFFSIDSTTTEEHLNQLKSLQHHQQQQQPSSLASSSTSTVVAANSQGAAPPKKKRNLPGNPNPDAEVIALSPKTLMATNRFICEVCNKGFQREQNLQLHRRGHNLPWKLKQKSTKEVRRRVYLCPEPTCVHHDPSRALGDLTGIKKHFSRKHGEKKWKCEKCSKRYAVQSDWKAHSKTCGTREYRCDCGTLFSRRDSFITHRAFCDALAQESARLPNGLSTIGSHLYGGSSCIGLGLSQVNSVQLSSLQQQTHSPADLLRLGAGAGGSVAAGAPFDQLVVSAANPPTFRPSSAFLFGGSATQGFGEDTHQTHQSYLQSKPFHGLMQLPDLQQNPNTSSAAAAAAANFFHLGFFPGAGGSTGSMNQSSNADNQNSHLMMHDQFSGVNAGGDQPAVNLFAGNVMTNHMGGGIPSILNSSAQNSSVLPQMSATALLQKAAQMGAATSNNSGARGGGGAAVISGFGSSMSLKPANMVDQGQSDQNHLQDIMNSFANGSSAMFNIDEARYQHQLSTVGGFGGSDGLTRDFLGVGSMMRGIARGVSQMEQHQGFDLGPIDPEMQSAAASSSRSFAAGSQR
ncbi:Zinc finger protein MAGPIE [Apostasia shenzhenica]|uniref:Protein EARLY HEADING DATE 2 n=1 Tax=Apostasia shenzhenica TaxID=1088818 RepID=A0A2I0AHL5_9ASPA|nr:Zinc finger protein MAGPIE [Apostasia shenzhenica]